VSLKGIAGRFYKSVMGAEIGVLPLSVTKSPAVGSSDGSSTASASASVRVVFSSGSGNWTVPTGITSVQIEVWGAGGGGGAGTDGASAGGSGGGGGGYCLKSALTVTPGQTIAYVVGAGGSAGTYDNDNATAGGNSSVASTYFANGGAKGRGGGVGANSATTAGGTASGGDTNTTGSSGAGRVSSSGGGAGGNSPNGGTGGAGGSGSSVVGTAGNAPGGGGGGGGKAANGAAGAAGRVFFTYTPALSTLYIDPSGISSVESLGTSSLLAAITGSGIDSVESLGTNVLAAYLTGSGITSAESLGTNVLNAYITGSGIDSVESLGTNVLNAYITGSGIDSVESLGTNVLAAYLTGSGITSAESLGTNTAFNAYVISSISSAESLGTNVLNAYITGSAITSAESLGTSSLLAAITGSGISSAESLGTSSFITTYISVGTADGGSTANAVGSLSVFSVGTADGESTADAVGEEINVYTSEGGEIILSSDSEFQFNSFFDQKVRWKTNAEFYVEKNFRWNTGDLVLKWYRVQGCCSSATKNENPSGGCDIINFQLDDPTCVGASSQQQFIQNIAANSLTDLCNQLTNSGLRWEICSIKKFSLPADLRGVDVNVCNTLTEVPFCDIPECIEYCIKTASVVYIKAKAWVEQVFVYESSGGEIILSSDSEIEAPEDAITFYESTGGEIILTSESESSSSWSNNMTISIKAFASVAFEEILFGENRNTPSITQSAATVSTTCGLCDAMPMVLHLNHNLSKTGELVDYLQRNGQSLPSSIPMHYNSKLKSWLGHYHLFGIGENNNNGQEKWNFSFSWSCDNNLGDSYWKFSSLITKTDLSEGTDYDTRLIIKFPPDQICSYSQNFSFNFTFNVNTFTKFVDNNFDLALNEIVLYDKIGMFKTKNWMKDPVLRMIVSKSSKTVDSQYKDITPILPGKPILY